MGAMMARIPGWLLRHKATVETYQGDSGAGPVYGPPVTVRGWLEDGERLFRDASGRETVSTATFYTRLDHAGRLTPNTRVTVNGRTSTVVNATRRDDNGLGAWQHLQVALT